MKEIKILAVDDEEINLEIITNYLQDAGFKVIGESDGERALTYLKEHNDIDIILLDYMMPKMDGITLLKLLKSEEKYKSIPVILQTAAASQTHVIEGIKAGAYYYLIKPYQEEMLISIIKAAERDLQANYEMIQEIKNGKLVTSMMKNSSFEFKTLAEAKNLSSFIANCFPDPEKVVFGITEILINAIEHGNLAISYDEKSRLLREGIWEEEINRRINLDEFKDKKAILNYHDKDDMTILHVIDQGEGFNWQEYMEIDYKRAVDPHGRGIAMARMMSFDEIEYLGKGNEVLLKLFKN